MLERRSTPSRASAMASRYCSTVSAVKSATSSCPRTTVSGVRNSCETSVENWRICSKERFRRVIM